MRHWCMTTAIQQRGVLKPWIPVIRADSTVTSRRYYLVGLPSEGTHRPQAENVVTHWCE